MSTRRRRLFALRSSTSITAMIHSFVFTLAATGPADVTAGGGGAAGGGAARGGAAAGGGGAGDGGVFAT